MKKINKHADSRPSPTNVNVAKSFLHYRLILFTIGVIFLVSNVYRGNPVIVSYSDQPLVPVNNRNRQLGEGLVVENEKLTAEIKALKQQLQRYTGQQEEQQQQSNQTTQISLREPNHDDEKLGSAHDGDEKVQTGIEEDAGNEKAANISNGNLDSNSTLSPSFTIPIFTKHVEEITMRVKQTSEYQPHNRCGLSIRLLVDRPYTRPSAIECSAWYYCDLIRHIFSEPQRLLPYNVSIGFELKDMIRYHHFGQCIGSSSPSGQFVMNNFHDVKAHAEAIIFTANAKSSNSKKHITGYEHKHTVPWEERHKIPVFRGQDMIRYHHFGQCIGSSSPRGQFVMNNFHDVKAHAEAISLNANVKRRRRHKQITGYEHVHTLPWEERHKIPVFRGHPRFPLKYEWRKNPNETCVNVTADQLGHRTTAALWSYEHPELLDAMIDDRPHPCSIYSATNLMDQRLYMRGNYTNDTATAAVFNRQPRNIPSSEYYTNYQVAVVLGGIGAAFRTAKHMSAGQAIVLQRFRFEEWFYDYIEPYVHYIPLQQDFSDLYNVTTWVRDNPSKVKEIAENGKRFYEEYLSFLKNEEHWYEFIYKLSLQTNSHPNVNGNNDDVWTNKKCQRYIPRNNQYELLKQEEK
mmetsp:Transcript_1361/g.3017  ORF Transcript_1361/g.3017 Transcript_1361/m.3017 type:complete len:630 (+) Transcript_1361:146-2035(+)